jgi:ribosomal protein S17
MRGFFFLHQIDERRSEATDSTHVHAFRIHQRVAAEGKIGSINQCVRIKKKKAFVVLRVDIHAAKVQNAGGI